MHLRRNLQRHLKGIAPLTEEQFDATISAADHASEASSISGSGSDDTDSGCSEDHQEHDVLQRNLSHTVVRHPSGRMYICWSSVFDIAEDARAMQQPGPPNSIYLQSRLSDEMPAYWTQPTAVILCSGGHFAATLFEQNRVVKSKTFHRYVVRAKQVLRFHRHRSYYCSDSCSGRQTSISGSEETHEQARPSVSKKYVALFYCVLILLYFASALVHHYGAITSSSCTTSAPHACNYCKQRLSV